jgi:DNA-binding NarL/FixJ family response regulator
MVTNSIDKTEVRLIQVLIIFGERPLLAGVKDLLKNEGDFNLISTAMTDIDGVTQEIKRIKPDVVIWDDKLPSEHQHALFNLLLTFKDLRAVVLSNYENKLQVYEKKEIPVLQVNDLFSAVRAF